MHVFKRILTGLNPFLYGVPILYGIVKLFDYMIGVDSILQIIWDKVREMLGDNLAYYNIGLLFLYPFIFYHLAILFFYMLVKFMERDKIKNMKLQAKDSEIETPENTIKVSQAQLKIFSTFQKIFFYF
jgi:hypothetical protein